ncbi:MAG: hypothetical protein HQM09_12940 [Candidatus Riflebacteria bacterium]|nr:hypothetical protein [Candidatus Riflebacteria bacterium]
MSHFSFILLCILLCVIVPGFAFDVDFQPHAQAGFFSVTFSDDEFPGISPMDLAVQATGSGTFGVFGAVNRRTSGSTAAQEKACYANIRLIQGAVEMYNMDHPQLIKNMDSSVLQILKNGQYISSIPTKPSPRCEYLNDGDLTQNGRIICRLHGHFYLTAEEEDNRRQAMREQLQAKSRFTVYGRCQEKGSISFQINNRLTGQALKQISLPIPENKASSSDVAETWIQQLSEKLLLLKAFTPIDSCFSYLNRQLSQALFPREKMDNQRRADTSRSRQNSPDLYSLTTGALAIQESLQLDRMTNPSGNTGGASIPITILSGPGIKSHPFKEMIGQKDPTVFPIDAMVPENFYYCHFSDINKELSFSDFFDRWGSSFLHSFQVSAHDAQVKEKLLGQLCLETSELTRLFGDRVIADLAICGADPFLHEGTDISVIFSIKNSILFEMNVGRYFTKAKAAFPNCLEEKLTVLDTPVYSLTTPDRHIRSFSCNSGDFKIYSNSLTAITRILTVARKQAPALGAADDYRYMRTIFPADPAKEDAFVYLSDSHIRQLVGPVWKIERQRRLQCVSSLRVLQNAVTLFHFLRLPGPISLEKLLQERVLEKEYLHCPDGGSYSWDSAGDEAVCSIHGRLRYITPILETQPSEITHEEKSDYDSFVQAYNQYWRQYFDPVGIRATLTPGHLHLETCILPLVATSIYDGFKRISGGAPVKLNLPDHPRAIMQLAGKLNIESLAKWDSRSEGMANDLIGRTTLTLDQFLGAIGSSFVLGFVDSTLKFGFDGEIIGQFLPGIGRDPISMLGLGFLMGSLNLPVYGLIEIKNTVIAEQFLREWLFNWATENAKARDNFNRWRFFDVKVYETAMGTNQSPIFTLDMMALILRLRIFFTIKEGCIIIASQRQILQDLLASDAPRLKTETNLEVRVNYRSFKEVADATRIRWQEQVRDSCLNNIGSLYALSRFRGLSPTTWAQKSLLINGYIPICPVGGVYTLNEAADAVQCSIHGDPLHPRQPFMPDPKAPLNKFFDGMQGLSASLQFTPEGIMTRVDLEHTP